MHKQPFSAKIIKHDRNKVDPNMEVIAAFINKYANEHSPRTDPFQSVSCLSTSSRRKGYIN